MSRKGGSAASVCFGIAPCWGQCWVHRNVNRETLKQPCGNKPKTAKPAKPTKGP